jgi:hypothetical protein
MRFFFSAKFEGLAGRADFPRCAIAALSGLLQRVIQAALFSWVHVLNEAGRTIPAFHYVVMETNILTHIRCIS